ncbi:ABC transporter substrate-binding protein [Reyranella soli]|jgi:NitT/TauT family transport system substrate-binding protein|uniref:Taurine ABC transporter substrate-binding protein n=1 Tax=Reyranella soli TaxID=1230389 RepID=A0A512N3Z8_9HYPH|nr:ABC transporter substrate-binding protein [Reyranella soli]GEP53341.1 taurine ABC transporter substrate-binding protein [Reyranella soli]
MGYASRLTVAGISLALLGAVAPAIDRTPALAQTAKLDAALSTGWWGHVPIILAIEKGYFKELGIDVEVKAIASSADRIRALAAGSVAFSNLGRIAVISEMANGNKSFFFFANVDDSPGNEGCWARQGFASFKDLKGRKVAANTSAQITMNGLLEAQGMTEKDVQFVNLPGGEMAGALARGDVDAACVWEPLFTNVKNAVPGGTLLGTDMDTPNYKKFGTMASPDIVIISRKLVEERPDLARKLATGIFKGVNYTNEHPEDTARTVATYFRQDPAVVLAAMKKFKYFGAEDWQEHMKRHTGQMEYLSKWLADNGKIARMPDVKAWENVSFIEK